MKKLYTIELTDEQVQALIELCDKISGYRKKSTDQHINDTPNVRCHQTPQPQPYYVDPWTSLNHELNQSWVRAGRNLAKVLSWLVKMTFYTTCFIMLVIWISQ